MKKVGGKSGRMLGKTPMMCQYQQIKSQYPDAILFFRLGDFYEMFGADAELASREMEITLTGREAGNKERVPMCGVPYHAADNYIAKLIQKGYKVAICEQVENPKVASGIVKREVIRVITPGTTLENQLLQNQNSNYIAAINITAKEELGLAFSDMSTGEFYLTEYTGWNAIHALRDELYRINPTEILIPNDPKKAASFQELLLPLDNPLCTHYQKEAFTYEQAHLKLLEHFGPESIKDGGKYKTAVSCAGVILTYLKETQKEDPQQIKSCQYIAQESHMMIDSTTFRNLEITRTLRLNEKKGSLIEVIDKTKTALGARMLRLWLEKPLIDKVTLEKRYTAVEVLSEQWLKRQELRTYLTEVYDLERIMTRIIYRRVNPKELIALKNSLQVLPQIKDAMDKLSKAQYLAELTQQCDPLTDLYTLIQEAIEENPPYNVKDGGVIKSGYNPEIDSLRQGSMHGKQWIARLENEEKEKTGIKSLKVGFNKVFGYYFEVTKANLALVPPHFQRKQTLANGERYVTEELLRLESQVLGAEEKLLALEEEIYHTLLQELAQSIQRVQKTSRVLAQLDVLQSLAEVAVQNRYTRPELLEKSEEILYFEELRHPVVEKVSGEVRFVPNNLVMDKDTNLYIITGPNMGGKSTFCRSVALAVLLAQAGSFVPAKKAVISLRDRVFARVGASDDLRSGQSTFMVEMNEVANILQHSSRDSLVILDEVGRGTSTYDGLSMAWAVSEYLVEVLKTKTLFATHYHELTQLVEQYPSIKNLSLAVKEKGEEIIFLHKIVQGPADKSYGIQVGRLAGLPEKVIIRAKEILRLLESEHLPKGQQELIFAPTVEQDKNTIPEECSEILVNISNLDLVKMTPLEALNELYQIQEALKKGQY